LTCIKRGRPLPKSVRNRSATAALSRSLGGVVSLTDVTALSDENRRNLILRAAVVSSETAKRTVVIKATAPRTTPQERHA
jgi:hypothetical protein